MCDFVVTKSFSEVLDLLYGEINMAQAHLAHAVDCGYSQSAIDERRGQVLALRYFWQTLTGDPLSESGIILKGGSDL